MNIDEESEMREKDLQCKKIIEKKDYYDILGLKKEATEDEIRRSYKKLAIKFHPDKNNSKFAADAFKKVSHAFSVLSNKEKKQNYDMFGNEEGMGMTNGGGFGRDDFDPFDLFNMFMNGGSFTMGGSRGRGTSTSYVFRNGNVEYKVFSSFPGNFGNMHSFFQEGSDNDHDEDDDDIFSQFFSNTRPGSRRVNQNRSNSSQNRNHQQRSNNINREEQNKRENERRQQLINQQLWSQIYQSLPLILVLIFVLLPYFFNRLF